MRIRPLFLVLLLLGIAGCRLPEDEWGVVRVVWNDFPWGRVLGHLIAWTILGAAVGLLIGAGVSALLKRWGAYRLPWPRVRFWLQVIVIVLNLIAMPVLFGWIGFLEGAYSSCEVAIRHSVIGKELLPKIAEVGADAICFADCAIENEDLVDWDEVHQEKRPVNVPRMLDRLDRLQADAADRISAKAKEKLFEENPDWKGGVGETVIDWTLPHVIHYLLNRKLHEKLEDAGVPDFLSDLRREALKDGDGMMTHAQLTAFLTDRVLIRMLLAPVRKWVNGTQWTTLGIVVLWFATPAVLMFLTRWIAFWWKRRRARQLCADRL